MIAEIKFEFDAAMDVDHKTLDVADEIFDEIVRYGKKLVAERMPRGIKVYVSGREDVYGKEI